MKRLIFIIFLVLAPMFSQEPAANDNLNEFLTSLSETAISEGELKQQINRFFKTADRACYLKIKDAVSFGENAVGYFRWEKGHGMSGPVLNKSYSIELLNKDMYLVKLPINGLMQNMGSWEKTESYCYFDFKDMNAMKIVVY